MKKLLFVVALLLASPAAAQWQTPVYSVPVGRGAGNTGFDNAVPGIAGVPVVSNGVAAKPSFAPVQNAGIAPGAANTMKGSLNGTATSDIQLVTCTLAYQLTQWISGVGWQCGINPLLPSRAVAATLDLSAFQSVRTLGYATPGDGGEATFLKANLASPFKDQYIISGTLVGGSGYTNGTYLGVRMPGGTGLGCMAKVTVAGGAVTAVDLSGNYCAQYAIGDVIVPLQFDVGGTGSGATFTVAATSTPTGSFTDTAGNKMQIVPGAEINIRQFGAKLDWNGVDATATNDILAFRSAFAYAVTPFSTAGAFVAGMPVYVPKGAAYLCAGGAPFTTLVVPQGVNLHSGAFQYAGTLKQCTVESSNAHFITLCDPNSSSGQFGCKLENIAVLTPGAASNGIAAIYSNSGQQAPLVNNVYILATARGCILYEIGKGGAANAIFENFDCEQTDSNTNKGFIGNSSGTQIVLRNTNFGCAPGNCAAGNYAINMVLGNFIIDTVHIEQHVDAINVATTSANDLHQIRGATINNGCTNGVTLAAGNPNNTITLENIQSSCTFTVLNGHGGGVNVVGHIMPQSRFAPNIVSY